MPSEALTGKQREGDRQRRQSRQHYGPPHGPKVPAEIHRTGVLMPCGPAAAHVTHRAAGNKATKTSNREANRPVLSPKARAASRGQPATAG
jgi:hypothetical protein